MFPGTREKRYSLCCYKVSLFTLMMVSLIMDIFFILNIVLFVLAIITMIVWKPRENWLHCVVKTYIWTKLILSALLFTLMLIPLGVNSGKLNTSNQICRDLYPNVDCPENRQAYVAGIVIPILLVLFNIVNFVVALQLLLAYQNWKAFFGRGQVVNPNFVGNTALMTAPPVYSGVQVSGPVRVGDGSVVGQAYTNPLAMNNVQVSNSMTGSMPAPVTFATNNNIMGSGIAYTPDVPITTVTREVVTTRVVNPN